MEHEREFIGETKGSQQERIHRAALERGQGVTPVIGGNPTSQNEVIRDRETPTSDAVLSWAGGEHVLSPGGGPDFTSELARVAGVSGPGLDRPSSGPDARPLTGLTTTPQCVESNSGRAMNTEQILGGK